jgi:broad specificity phosphatase PhoE
MRHLFLIFLCLLALCGCTSQATPRAAPTETPLAIAPAQPPPTSAPATASPQPTATHTFTASPSATRTASPTHPPTVEPTTPAPTLPSETPDEPGGLVGTLRNGGYTLVFRHAITDRTQTDTVPQVLEDCTKQRNLNEAGRAQAREIGAAILALKIPIGRVLSSPYCRTRETAMLAFGRVESTPLLDNAFINVERRAALEASLRQLVMENPAAGTNTVLVTHGDNMSRALGVSVAEGEAAIVRAEEGGGFTVIAEVTSEEWTVLASRIVE